jgi:threonine dehydratase
VPIGGGGLCSGTLVAANRFNEKVKVIGVEPYLARDAKESIEKNCIQPQYPPLTLAEGVRTCIGDVTFTFLRSLLHDIVLVEEIEMIQASQLFQERMKIVVELSGALVLAAIIKD